MKVKVPEQVADIMNRLMEYGYEAYAVGGCVRDRILDRIPGDWDITTSAKPEEVKALFQRTIDTGIEHGTVTVMIGKEGYEVTTYRIDGEYEDNRHPKSVEFTSNLIEDLKRRDFTINAMAYNPTTGIVDAFHGLEDLKEGIIRCVGTAENRFTEDALRILRAIRFAGQLGFTIEEETKRAIQKKVPLLRNISAERIRTELNKLIVSKHPELLIEAYELGITKIILPEFDSFTKKERNQVIRAISQVNQLIKDGAVCSEKNHVVLCYSMLLCYLPDAVTQTKEVLKRLKFDNYTIDTAVHLVKHRKDAVITTEIGVRRQSSQIGVEYMPLYFLMKRADILARQGVEQGQQLYETAQLEKLFQEMIHAGYAVTLKELAVDGKTLIELGFQPGKQLGEILKELLEVVIEEPSYNEKDKLIAYVEQHFFLQKS